MIGELNYNPFSASTLNLLTRNSLRFQPLTGGQLAAKAMFGGGGGGGASSVSASNPEILNQRDPSKYPPRTVDEGMSTTTMAAIGIGVLAAGLIAFKLMKKRR